MSMAPHNNRDFTRFMMPLRSEHDTDGKSWDSDYRLDEGWFLFLVKIAHAHQLRARLYVQYRLEQQVVAPNHCCCTSSM